jgi:hypothetical protein
LNLLAIHNPLHANRIIEECDDDNSDMIEEEDILRNEEEQIENEMMLMEAGSHGRG